MRFLVAYDVRTEKPAGRRRLRAVSQACKNFGQRVQYSVFECDVNDCQFELLRATLCAIIDHKEDSLRIYKLHGKRDDFLLCYGVDTYVDYDEPLIF